MESINTKGVRGVEDTHRKISSGEGVRKGVMEVMLDLQGWNFAMQRDH